MLIRLILVKQIRFKDTVGNQLFRVIYKFIPFSQVQCNDVPGLVNFVPAAAVVYHFCLSLPAAFSQPNHLCTLELRL